MSRLCAFGLKIFTVAFFGSLLAHTAMAQISNGSFESPKLSNGQTAEPFPTGYGWVANGSAGLVRDAAYGGGDPVRVDPPMGRQWAVLKPGTSISQTVTLTAGYHYVGMNAMQMMGTPSPMYLSVTLNGAGQSLMPQNLTGSAIGVTAPALIFGPLYVAGGTYTLQIQPYLTSSTPQPAGVWLDNVVIYKQGVNAPPSVAVTYPNAGQTLINSTTELRATAVDLDGTVSQVKFYDGATLLGTVTSPPWKLAISTASVATRGITAKAFDGIVETTSDPLVFSHNTGGVPPYLTNGNFENPVLPDGGSLCCGSITGWSNSQFSLLIAQGYGYYANYAGYFTRPGEGRQSGLLGVDYAGESLQYWGYISLPAGDYGISFLASGNGGQQIQVSNDLYGPVLGTVAANNTRQAIPFTLTGPGLMRPALRTLQQSWSLTTIDDVRIGPAGSPTVSIVAPSNGQVFDAPTAITLVAAIDSFDRNVTEVEYFAGATSIGKSTTYPYSVVWANAPPNPPPNTYAITAKVKDSQSGAAVSATSAPITVTVNAPLAPAFFNPGFEYRSYDGYAAYIAASQPAQGWRSSGFGSLVYTNGVVYQFPNTPHGIAFADVDANSWIEQDVYLPQGSYQVRFKAAMLGWTGYYPTAQVRVNGAALGTAITPTTSFADYTTTASITVSAMTAGLHTIRIQNVLPGGVGYLGLDDFRIVVTPPLPTLPGAPTINVVAAGYNSATVYFSAPASNGGSPITGYTATCGGIQSPIGAGSPVVVTGLVGGLTVSCTVHAINSVGNGSNSAPLDVTPLTPAAPGAPQNVNAIMDFMDGIASIIVYVPAPTTDGGRAITSYTVTAQPGGAATSGQGQAYRFTGLPEGVSYTFTATATNAIGTGPASMDSAPVKFPFTVKARDCLGPSFPFTAGAQYNDTATNGVRPDNWTLQARWQSGNVDTADTFVASGLDADLSGITGLTSPMLNAFYQVGRKGTGPDGEVQAGGLQTNCWSVGMAINTWAVVESRNVTGGSYNDMFGYSWSTDNAPEAFRKNGAPAGLVMSANIGVPTLKAWKRDSEAAAWLPVVDATTSSASDLINVDVTFFAYLTDVSRPNLKPIVLIAAVFGYGRNDRTACPSVVSRDYGPTDDPRYPTGGVYFVSTGICDTAYTNFVRGSGTLLQPGFGPVPFSIEWPESKLANIATGINGMISADCLVNGSTKPDATLPAQCYSRTSSNYKLLYGGVISELSLLVDGGHNNLSPRRQGLVGVSVDKLGIFQR